MVRSSRPQCILLCVGSELLRGKLNTHAAYIARQLASIGLSLDEESTVSDELPDITVVMRRALDRFQVVIVSGGLGPTFDDLTREAASDATGRPLKISAPILKGLKAKFKKARYPMPAANARQAYLLEGAQAIENRNGTAPGQWLERQWRQGDTETGRHREKIISPRPPVPASPRQVLILLPGPPRELYPMFESVVLPKLKKQFPSRPRVEAHLHFVNVPESIVDAKVRPIIAREQKSGKEDVQFTILAHLGLVDFDVFVSGESKSHAQATLKRIVQAVRKGVGSGWYGSDDAYPLEKVVGDLFRKKRATLALAESCTGGMLASRLTEISKSSEFFTESVVSYSNVAKMRYMGVPESLLKKHGAVSEPVAVAMAEGIRQRAQTTWGLSITGIAGPTGGTPSKPVGLVYIALASHQKTICKAYRFSGDRSAVRERAVLAALDLLRQS